MKIRPNREILILFIFLLITDLSILLDIPFLRQILGFILLTFLPGVLILQILNLKKIGLTERFVLSVGLSISFLILFGLLVNNLFYSLGFEKPLSTLSLLFSFNIAFILLGVVIIKYNNSVFSVPIYGLTTTERAFLIIPVLFPALSVIGTHQVEMFNNNIFLVLLLVLISLYVVIACIYQKRLERIYPIVLFLISISLLLLLSLRSMHIIGVDSHFEYYFFRITMENLHWTVEGNSLFNATLSVSLLPTIYQSILNIDPESIFKLIYSLIYSVSPLVVYVISKKYVENPYSFLSSCFFMFQHNFLWTEYNARTNIAILFFALSMMVLFCDNIDLMKKRLLLVVFVFVCILSHYSTAYIFFFVLLAMFVGKYLLSTKDSAEKVVTFGIVILFAVLIFFWYSQIVETPFTAGVRFIEETFHSLNTFFVEDTRGESTQTLFGKNIAEKYVPHKLEFIFTWLTFVYIFIGVITLIKNYKSMSFPGLNIRKKYFLSNKFEVEYFLITILFVGVLISAVALPFVSGHYGLDRSFALASTILSTFFVIGGIVLTEFLSLLCKKMAHVKIPQITPYFIILLVLIPYFFCVNGIAYNIYGIPRSIILNSEGEQYDLLYINEQEGLCAEWVSRNHVERFNIYTLDSLSRCILFSQGMIYFYNVSLVSVTELNNTKGYLYLRYLNIVTKDNVDNFTKYFFINEKNKIYNSGKSEVCM